ncbi:fimbrial protein [Cronobacter malonaticus]|uniref:fimbrial protein n=1 Tax=Cronobacter malonaticus TaxID=413503 RepID=UPI001F477F35|nr:fimbrial protein [Cronobacter malonaticus]
MNKAIILGLLSIFVFTRSTGEDNTAIITVTVTVNAAPCEINNNQLIDVDFGDSVITTDVAKGAVEKMINYTLDCTNAAPSKTLAMRISGTGAGFDDKVLKPAFLSWDKNESRWRRLPVK